MLKIALLEFAEKVELNPGDILYQEGQRADSVYLFETGMASMFVGHNVKVMGSSRTALANINQLGQLIGLDALYSIRYTETVQALDECSFYKINMVELWKNMHRNEIISSLITAIEITMDNFKKEIKLNTSEETPVMHLVMYHQGYEISDLLNPEKLIEILKGFVTKFKGLKIQLLTLQEDEVSAMHEESRDHHAKVEAFAF